MLKVKVDCYSRVSGFYTPISQWNKGKKSEYENRKFYKIKGILEDEEK